MLDTGHRRYDGKPALSEFVSAADCHRQRLSLPSANDISPKTSQPISSRYARRDRAHANRRNGVVSNDQENCRYRARPGWRTHTSARRRLGADACRFRLQGECYGVSLKGENDNPLEAGAFATLDRGRLAVFKVRLHPSVFILSSVYPVVSIWEANQAQWVAPFSPAARSDAHRQAVHRGRHGRLAPGNAAFFACLGSSSSIGVSRAGAAASAAFSPCRCARHSDRRKYRSCIEA